MPLPPLSSSLSILLNFSLIFSNTRPQISYHSIQTKFLLYTSPVTHSSETLLLLDLIPPLLSSAFLFSFLLILLLLLLSSSQILLLSLSHSSNSLTPPKYFLLLYNPSISLNTLVFPSSLIYPKSFLLHIPFSSLSLLEEVRSSSIALSAHDTSLSFSH